MASVVTSPTTPLTVPRANNLSQKRPLRTSQTSPLSTNSSTGSSSNNNSASKRPRGGSSSDTSNELPSAIDSIKEELTAADNDRQGAMYACSPSIVPPAFATQFNQNPFNFDNANSATAGASNDQEDQGPRSQVASANHIVPASTTNQAFANANQLIEQAEEFSLSPQNLVDPNHKAGNTMAFISYWTVK